MKIINVVIYSCVSFAEWTVSPKRVRNSSSLGGEGICGYIWDENNTLGILQ